MKILLLAAALASTCILPAMAQTAPANAEVAKHRAEFKAKRDAARAEGDSARTEQKQAAAQFRQQAQAAAADCRAKVRAATTPEAKKAAMDACRTQEDTMRKQMTDANTKRIEARRAKMDDIMKQQ